MGNICWKTRIYFCHKKNQVTSLSSGEPGVHLWELPRAQRSDESWIVGCLLLGLVDCCRMFAACVCLGDWKRNFVEIHQRLYDVHICTYMIIHAPQQVLLLEGLPRFQQYDWQTGIGVGKQKPERQLMSRVTRPNPNLSVQQIWPHQQEGQSCLWSCMDVRHERQCYLTSIQTMDFLNEWKESFQFF